MEGIMSKIRIGTFNCENLFRRTKVLNLEDESKGTEALAKISRLEGLIDKKNYIDDVKQKIFNLSAELKEFIDFRVDSGSFGSWKKSAGYQVNKKCKGRGDWTGQLTFRDEPFSDTQRENTARVIKDAGTDVLCAVEVEDMETVQKFNTEALKHMYAQYISIDSPNDPRGIDVACLSKYPIIDIKTHIFDGFGAYSHVFSRDCLEVALDISGSEPLHVLCNHFKSQLARSKKEKDDAAAKRLAQATKVVKILDETYALDKELVAVMGDLNEDSSNSYQSLKPLFKCKDLFPLVDPNADVKDRYTHYYAGGSKGKQLSQLDYIFVSKALHEKFKDLGFVRNGIFGVDKAAADIGATPVEIYPTVTDWNLSASDHAALWAEFEV
jgi:endonuclease/exonuclease/phosphatase family metal-dependent hydrolase